MLFSTHINCTLTLLGRDASLAFSKPKMTNLVFFKSHWPKIMKALAEHHVFGILHPIWWQLWQVESLKNWQPTLL